MGRLERQGATAEPTVLGALAVLLRHWRWFLTVPLLGAAVGIAAVVSLRDYRARSTFSPQGPPQLGGQLSGLAAEFGVNLGSLSPAEPIGYYVELLRSRELLTDVLQTEFEVPGSQGTLNAGRARLVDLMELEDEESARDRLLAGVKYLQDRIAARADLDAGLVILETRAEWPDLAEQLNRRMLTLLQEFNLEKRQSRASAEREFVAERLRDGESELEAAEADLRRFLEENRTYQDSPRLLYEARRLERRVEVRQQVYLTLTQAYEQARIEEVRNTPVITVMDAPEGSGRRRGSLAVGAVLGFLGGLLLTAFGAVGREYLRWERALNPEQYGELVEIRRAAVRSLPFSKASPAPEPGIRDNRDS